jgi:hypothetical protein
LLPPTAASDTDMSASSPIVMVRRIADLLMGGGFCHLNH